MIRYFCDTCNKDITDEMRFNCAILYERKSTITSLCNHKIANRKDFCLCEECNNKMVEKIKKFFLKERGLKMEFKIDDYFYVSETDLDRMAYLCIENGDFSIHESINAIAGEWDDANFYTFGLVEDKVAEEVARRVKLYE